MTKTLVLFHLILLTFDRVRRIRLTVALGQTLGVPRQSRGTTSIIHTEFGKVISYQQLAERAGSPRAQRAVGSALATNHIGFLIPCHRVIRESGDAGSYRWGNERKLAMLAWEAGRVNQ
jgi:O-6-methylguanine DNA methyltransferase